MMDPFSALSVAANIVQFVVYGINIVSKGNEIYNSADGALIENAELEEATARLQQLTRTFQDSLDLSLLTGSSAQNEQALQKICDECVAVSQEMIEKLEKLKVSKDHPHRKWKSFRQALKSVWPKEKIEEVAQRLADLRTELDTHVLMSVRKQITTMSIEQSSQFKSLDNEVKKVVLALLGNNDVLLASIESNFKTLSTSSQIEHAKTRELFQNQAEARHRRRAELHILESLRFETMTYRYETISEAHQHTFEWIFRDPDAEGKPWNSFIRWAESEAGIYWINGKAGSGKSTLMRFLVEDPRTRDHLEQWAPRDKLNTPAFFFWNSGVPEQKSQEGLLRSIIYEVLQNHTDLFPAVLPDEWTKVLELLRHDITPISEAWSLSRLRKTFRKLVGCASNHFQFCFFIDGLDEYNGNHEEIADYFSELSSLPFIKFCISSRPLMVFKDTFSTSPALRLQDLTSDDIEKYVNDKLNGHKRMKLLTTKDSKSSNRLVQGLIDKAEGVFLWVTLVVAALLKGLGLRDGFPQLWKRLEMFPSDLEPLYGYMLSSIEPIYMQEGARLFQIYKTELQMSGSATGEQFYTAYMVDLPRVFGTTTEDLQRARNEEVELLDCPRFERLLYEEVCIYNPESLFEHMDYLLRTRCGGLIEINKNRNSTISSTRYLHRTVSEYLDREDIWKGICRHAASISNFYPALQILMCNVLRLKRLSLIKGPALRGINDAIFGIWERLAFLIRKCYDNNIPIEIAGVQSQLLNEFDRQAIELNRKANSSNPEKGSLGHWSNWPFPETWKSDFLCEAIRRGLLYYVEDRLLTSQAPLRRESGLPLLGFIFFKEMEYIDEAYLRVLELLLSKGADPNEVLEGHSIWQYFVHYLHSDSGVRRVMRRGMWGDGKVIKQMLKAFMKAGADLNCKVFYTR